MIAVVRKTGHSSYYVEKGMGAMGKTPKQMGIQGEYRMNGGGKAHVLFYDACIDLYFASFPNLA